MTSRGCERKHKAKGLCEFHYQRFRKRMPLDTPIQFQQKGRLCSVEGCERKHSAKGFCRAHYRRSVKGTSLDTPIRFKLMCSIEGCERNYRTKGFCAFHYYRWQRNIDFKKPISNKRKEIGSTRPGSRGYLLVKVKNGVSGWMPQHRYVMEQHLGRSLVSPEEVHHLNGVRNDNRLENLELWSTAQPPGQRVADKVKFALEILETYGLYNTRRER